MCENILLSYEIWIKKCISKDRKLSKSFPPKYPKSLNLQRWGKQALSSQQVQDLILTEYNKSVPVVLFYGASWLVTQQLSPSNCATDREVQPGCPDPVPRQRESEAALPACTPGHRAFGSCLVLGKRRAPTAFEMALFSKMQLFLRVENWIGSSVARVSLCAAITLMY